MPRIGRRREEAAGQRGAQSDIKKDPKKKKRATPKRTMAANGKAEKRAEGGKRKEGWPNPGKSLSRGGQGANDLTTASLNQKRRFFRAIYDP
jgi:hypothetical protein